MRKIVFILLVGLLGACVKETPPKPNPILRIPDGFPAMKFPEDNPFTYEKWELGKRLFYDPIMSEDFSMSCGSCHHAEIAFSDYVAISPGVGGELGTRNSPSLANVGYHPYFTREGGVPTLEMQILVPIQEHAEFNFNIVRIAERMKEDPSYVQSAIDIFDRQPDAYVITRAIATFERTLISGNSAYDQANRGLIKLSAEAEKGKELFFSDRTHCSSCHGDFNFTNYAFENNGLYEEYEDVGRFRLTFDPADSNLFKVPSLRNVELTAPYMHNGAFTSIREVLNHYNEGGKNHPQKSELIQPLHLNSDELDALEAFLRSLTDHEFISNELFKDEHPQ